MLQHNPPKFYFMNARNHKPRSMRTKLWLAMGSIAAILLLSSVISILEYKRMSTYVSELVNRDIMSVNAAGDLYVCCERYNLEMLAAIGEADSTITVNFNQDSVSALCDSSAFTLDQIVPDNNVRWAYDNFMAVSKELKDVIVSDFIDSRQWYFKRLQPKFTVFTDCVQTFSSSINADLSDKSETFQAGFYRCILPGIVAVCAGFLLIILLMVFISSYYVNPIVKIMTALQAFNSTATKKYNCTFDGDDELNAINAAITDLTAENLELRRRIKDLKSKE